MIVQQVGDLLAEIAGGALRFCWWSRPLERDADIASRLSQDTAASLFEGHACGTQGQRGRAQGMGNV